MNQASTCTLPEQYRIEALSEIQINLLAKVRFADSLLLVTVRIKQVAR